MDELKLFGKAEREINGLVSIMQIFGKDVWMELRIKKHRILIIQKLISSDGVEL